MSTRRSRSIYVRNVIFGIEDSLVATAGLVAGITAAQVTHHVILLTACVYVFVEAFAMAVGSFLSEESAEEYETKREATGQAPLSAGIVMFVSCIVGGFLPVIPYLFLTGVTALYASIAVSLATLGLLGYIHAKISHVRVAVHIGKMMLLGGLAIAIGIGVGRLFN